MSKNLVGKILGQYELVEIAGEGGVATVYKAYQHSLQRWVAVKVLHIHEKETLARFKREAKAAGRLRHRNILMVYQYEEEGEWPYIAMEYIEEGTLEKYLQGEPLNWQKVVTLSISIAQALHEAHKQGLIHRDVKPSNILMPQEDWPLLSDFGLVKIPDTKEALTVSGVIMGTPSYIAPEQALGKKADHRADIYSLGAVMFEMIAGRLPFDKPNASLIMWAHISEPPPAPRKLNPQCPPGLEKIILKALEKAPEDRYADMQAMIDDLHLLMGGSTFPVPSSFPYDKSTQALPDDTPARPPVRAPQPAPPPKRTPSEAAQLLLSEKDVAIDLPDPGQNGLVIGRTHRNTRVEVDLGPYGAAQAGISRQHAHLIKSGSDWQLTDLGSLNGTYVNNDKLTPGTFQTLKHGDTVRFSLMSFVFSLPEES